MTKYDNKKIIAVSIIILLFLGVGVYGLTRQRAANDSVKAAPSLGKLHLSPSASILIDSMKQDYVDTSVANRTEEPLTTELSDNTSEAETRDLQEPAELPWFYYSPTVKPVSEQSLVQKLTLIERENVNGFAWYQADDEILLYQADEPYTGFYATAFDGWDYYEEGKYHHQVFTNLEAAETTRQAKQLHQLMPKTRVGLFFIEDAAGTAQYVDRKLVSYPILYRATDELILTAPAGTVGSYLTATTENFFEIPMEVVEEVDTVDGTWLHVNIGYDELGWIRKDESLTDYVYTYYSERDLLDAIEAVVWDYIEVMDARVGVSFVNNETMSQVSMNNQSFFPASTQKIYVMGEVYHQYKTGELDPYESYVTLYDEDKVGGAGTLQSYPAGSVFSVNELVDLVMILSDNTAANMLIDTVGGGPVINPRVQQLGLHDTVVTGKYYGGDSTYFTTTPADAARYFALLYNDQVNGEPWDELLINKFNLNSHSYLRQYVWGDTHSWNKSGIGYTEQNDVATFVTPYGSYSLALFSDYPSNPNVLVEQIGQLSVAVHDTFNEIRSLLWISVE